jgi:hypothetical protein
VDVDFAAAWLDLKAHIVSKKSHGARELSLTMSKLEVEHRVPDGQRGFSDQPAPLRSRGTPETAHEPPMAARDV